MALGRRWIGIIPRLTRRPWEDVARELEEFLRKIWGSEADGIPSGFKDETPAFVQAAEATSDLGAAGTLGSGWAAADHRHVASSGVPVPVGVEIAEGEGAATTLARSDHKHRVEAWRATGLTVDGGVGTVTTGFKGYVVAPFSGTITSWTIRGDPAGSCVFDVWKNWRVPSVIDSICGAFKPTLSTETEADGTVSGWSNLTVTKGDIFAFNVESASTLRVVTLVVKVRETA